MYVNVYMCVYACMCICMHICVYVCIYMVYIASVCFIPCSAVLSCVFGPQEE